MYKVPQLPLEFIRTQSAPPEGKEGELGALRNKVNLSNQQQVANLNKEKVHIFLKKISHIYLKYIRNFPSNHKNFSKPPQPHLRTTTTTRPHP